MKFLPNFLCVGTQRAGTTALFSALRLHPEICLTPYKETKFFLDEEKFSRGLEFYLNQYYKNCGDEKIIGEFDPDYMYFEEVPARIKQVLGDKVKLLFILRDPVSRAYSHYWLTKRRGLEELSFEEAIKVEKQRLSKGYFERLHFSYTDRGFYSRQIERFLKLFPRKNMHFMLFEKLIDSPFPEIKRLLLFLEVDPSWAGTIAENFTPKNVKGLSRFTALSRFIFKDNPIKKIFRKILPYRLRKKFTEKLFWLIEEKNMKPFSPPPLQENLKRNLKLLYAEEVEKLEDILDIDLSIWKR